LNSKSEFVKQLQSNIPEETTPEELKEYPTLTFKEVIDVLEQAKKDLSEVIQKPNEDDYETTIPYQVTQFEEDLERYNRFKKWFGEA
jgi:hypothetical protein